jgi:hypothetical protein
MRTTIVGTICPSETAAAINRDIIYVIEKKKLLINDNSIGIDDKLDTLKVYNDTIIGLEHDLSTLYN